jgi:hemin uptake protein HemP
MIDYEQESIDSDKCTQPSREVPVRRGEINSQELFQSEREVRIRHGDQTYRLRVTALNKLILTK